MKTGRHLKKAARLEQAERWEEAEKCYSRVLRSEPENLDALAGLGLLSLRTQRYEAAIQLLSLALTLRPREAELHHHLSLAYSRADHPERALIHAQKASELLPNSPEPLYNAGSLLLKLKQFPEAALALARAAKLRPAHPPTMNNLGLALARCGRFPEATQALEMAIQQNSDYSEAFHNLGLVAHCLGQLPVAQRLFQHALELQAEPGTYHSLGMTHKESGDLGTASACFERALQLNPDFWRARLQLAECHLRRGRSEEAQNLVRQVLGQRPDNAGARHLASVLSGDLPQQLEPEYVRELFDDYADSFDGHLLKTLDYRAPRLIWETYQRCCPQKNSYRILDLGCGTGLCGQEFRGQCQTLVGVDLSPRMLGFAAQKAIYHQLHEADILDYLRQEPAQSFDLLLAADVLNYLGRLEPLLKAAFESLSAEGCLLATVERGEVEFDLHSSGRYRHSSEYVRARLETAGFEVVLLEEHPLRMECGAPVAGLVFCARKP